MAKWLNATEAGDSPDALFDRRTIFEMRCRQKGTRINWIMTMIERGLDDKEIAERVRARTKHPCDKRTIRVYRKALYGQLCDMRTGRGNQSDRGSVIKGNFEKVGALYFGQNIGRGEIARMMKLTPTTVDSCIERYRREFNAERSGKHGRADESRQDAGD